MTKLSSGGFYEKYDNGLMKIHFLTQVPAGTTSNFTIPDNLSFKDSNFVVYSSDYGQTSAGPQDYFIIKAMPLSKTSFATTISRLDSGGIGIQRAILFELVGFYK